MTILKSLNSKQKEAVLHTEGPLLIIAGAGSGKTRVLTHRIAYMIKEKGVPPSSILAVTFTNKAANEMKHRLNHLTGILSRSIWIGTFHSICGRILRHDIDKIGWRKDFLIFDEYDQEVLIRDIIKDLDLDERFKPAVVLEKISKAKNELKGPEQNMRRPRSISRPKKWRKPTEDIRRRSSRTTRWILTTCSMLTVKLFREAPKVLEHYQDILRYISVDEYQDTNYVQYVLTKMLASKYRNICVVGDNDQSIYGWRGADFRNILNFERDWKDAKVVMLEQNYRSTRTILEAANSVIAKNEIEERKKPLDGEPRGRTDRALRRGRRPRRGEAHHS